MGKSKKFKPHNGVLFTFQIEDKPGRKHIAPPVRIFKSKKDKEEKHKKNLAIDHEE